MDSTFMAKQDFTTQELQLLSSEMEKRKKSTGTAWLLLIFFGWTGAHRYYLGYVGSGIAMTLTLGGLGWWVLVDLFLNNSMIRQANEQVERETIESIQLMRQAKVNDTNQRLQEHGIQNKQSDSVSLDK